MNRAQAAALLPVIQAYADGKPIQWRERDLGYPNRWCTTTGQLAEITFDLDEWEFRLPPEPVVRWGITNTNGTFCTTAATREEAEEYVGRGRGQRVFKMMEVPE